MSKVAVLAFSMLGFAAGVCLGAELPVRVAHIGFLRAEVPDSLLKSFRDGMRDLGYVEGSNFIVEERWARGRYEDLPRLAKELVDRKVDVIVAASTPSVAAAARATQTIPIVIAASGDHLGSGFVASLARPGGNVTGLTIMSNELSVKRLELLKEVAPRVKRVAVLWSAKNPVWSEIIERMDERACGLGMRTEGVKVLGSSDLDPALDRIARGRYDALYVFEDPLFRNDAVKLVAFGIKHRLPVFYGAAEFVRIGGLISYAPDFDKMFRKAAGIVDRILKGANPAELPVEQPTQFVLAVNLKTAKAIALTIPELILVRADEVIQ
jgi:putative ABC transport system substrate-binding protein